MSVHNIRTDTKFVTVNFRGYGSILKKFSSVVMSPNQEQRGQPSGPPVQDPSIKLWNNAGNVSGEILEKALRNNGFLLSRIYRSQSPDGQPVFKIVFKNVLGVKGTEEEPGLRAEHDELTADQLEMAREVLSKCAQFSHAQLYAAAAPRIPNVQIIMQNIAQKPLRLLTVRGGQLLTVLDKDLNDDERQRDVVHQFASKLTGR